MYTHKKRTLTITVVSDSSASAHGWGLEGEPDVCIKIHKGLDEN